MDSIVADLGGGNLRLPDKAPQVRVTAGVGTPGQKTWNLRRPVTLIGAQRKAHIALHAAEVSRAHCVILNTGSSVLLKDLHTSIGTRRNGLSVDLVTLGNGDVIGVGGVQVTVSITDERAGASDSHPAGSPAVKPQPPLEMFEEGRDTPRRVLHSVAILGSSPTAEVHCDGISVEPAHALVFRFAGGWAIFDLGSRSGTFINEQPTVAAALQPGDTLRIGAHRLLIGRTAEPMRPLRPEWPLSPSNSARPQSRNRGAPDPQRHLQQTAPVEKHEEPAAGSPEPSSRSVTDIEAGIAAIRAGVDRSWEQVNGKSGWGVDHASVVLSPSSAAEDLTALAQALDAREAHLRGLLHDLERCCEQFLQKERELAGQASRIHEQRVKLYQDQASWAKKKSELARKAAELERMRQALASRGAGPR